MASPERRAPGQTLKFLFVVFLAAAAMPGCTGEKSREHELDAYFKANPQYKRVATAKFSGHVTIDGQPPEATGRLFIVLFDADKYKDSKAPRYEARVEPDGHFSFTTYIADDGAPVGKWIACFVDPRSESVQHQKVGARSFAPPGESQYSGHDALHNLYNDPEKNLQDPQFVIDLQAPGITDANFNLQVAGKDPVAAPGQYAVTNIVFD
jgi:hypothetical protein